MRTRRRRRWLGAAAALVAQLTAGSVGAALPDGARGSESLADLESLAPGVYVRVPPLETPDESPGNQGVVVFDDGLLIIDAGPPHVAAPLAERLASRFEVPVRWLFATHFHPDHSLGSSMWAADGIRFFAAEGGRSGFENVVYPMVARREEGQPADAMRYVRPTDFFADALEVPGRGPRVELIPIGSGHSQGDAVAWLPDHGIVFTGDLCVNGPFNNFGSARLDEWSAALDQLQALPVRIVVPGHGPVAGPGLLAVQARYVAELRNEVLAAMRRGDTLETLLGGIDLPVFEDWTGIPVAEVPDQVRQAFESVGGGRSPAERRWRRIRRNAPYAIAGLVAVLLAGGYWWRRRATGADPQALP